MFREDFPQLDDGCIYLDNAATTLKPIQVISAVSDFYRHDVANPRRGFYSRSYQLDQRIDEVRQKVLDFLGGNESYSVIFTRGATESLNMLAAGLKYKNVALTRLEHHSNLLPWRRYAEKTQVVEYDLSGKLAPIPPADIVTFSGMSNVLGFIPNAKNIISQAKNNHSLTVLDASQLVAHQRINLSELDVDFIVFSGHKIFGPSGIGVLCGKTSQLEKLQPMFYGGEMIDSVSDSSYKLAEIPARFEAGSINSAGIIGLGSALDYLKNHNAFDYLSELSDYLENKLAQIPHLRFWGENGIFSFQVDDVHPHDIAAILDNSNIFVRAGYHCAEPLLSHVKIGATARISLAPYNTRSEIDSTVREIQKIRQRMGL